MASAVGSIFGASGAAVNFIKNTYLNVQANPSRSNPSIGESSTRLQADPLSTKGAARGIRTQAAEAVSDVLRSKAAQRLGVLVETSI